MTIYATPHGTATPNHYAARIKAEVEAKTVTLPHPMVLARIKLNPVSKGTMK